MNAVVAEDDVGYMNLCFHSTLITSVYYKPHKSIYSNSFWFYLKKILIVIPFLKC